jgi:acyl-CoA thioester hydrolase
LLWVRPGESDWGALLESAVTNDKRFCAAADAAAHATPMKKEEGRLVRTDRVPMRWGEMDALGHMNNVSYFRYFEQARISWFDSLKIDYRPGSEGPILGTLSCRYVRPAVYPADIELTTYVGKAGRSSFSMCHDMYLAGDPGMLFAQAQAVMVWIDISDGKSRPLPDWMRRELG